jgi:hypothetical protein
MKRAVPPVVDSILPIGDEFYSRRISRTSGASRACVCFVYPQMTQMFCDPQMTQMDADLLFWRASGAP